MQMLKGELPTETKARWDWDRNLEGIPENVMLPERELKNIEK